MDIKKIIIENAYEFEKDRFIIGLGNIDQIIAEINQALQLQQTGVKQSVLFADWIVKKGYKLNQMNYSNNGGMWFFDKKSVGCTTAELYKQYVYETVA